LASDAGVLAFVVAFGVAKAVTNLGAGALADRIGRKRLLVLGWLLALPVAPLIALAPGWWLIVVANLFLGANQGLAWSMTVVMKIDLAGPVRRGLAVGLNESAGYVGLAAAALATGALAASYAPRTVVWARVAALAWGLGPLYRAAHGASVAQIGVLAAVYPAVWGTLQLGAGWLSDHIGRKRPIVLGMVVQGGALALLVGGNGAFGPALAAAALL